MLIKIPRHCYVRADLINTVQVFPDEECFCIRVVYWIKRDPASDSTGLCQFDGPRRGVKFESMDEAEKFAESFCEKVNRLLSMRRGE